MKKTLWLGVALVGVLSLSAYAGDACCPKEAAAKKAIACAACCAKADAKACETCKTEGKCCEACAKKCQAAGDCVCKKDAACAEKK